MIIQVIACIILIGSIMLQSSKGEGLSGSIGGAGAGSGAQMWGKQARGFDALLAKVTKIAAILFVVVAIALVAIQ